MSSLAKANPKQFYIGIDANTKPLEKPSIKVTRKPAKGGLPNAMFVQAAIEDLPCELDAIASEIYINFPWGSLLRAVALADENILASLYRIIASDGRMSITIGTDAVRDRAELDRLGLGELTGNHFIERLIYRYMTAGFRSAEYRQLAESAWSRIDTSWARKLSGNHSRRVFQLSFVRK